MSDNIKAHVCDPDLLTNDTSSCEVMLMFFDEKEDGSKVKTDKLMMAWMKRDNLITGHPIMGGIMLFDSGIYEKQGGATIEQAFTNDKLDVISWKATEEFVGRRNVPTDKRKKPTYLLQRIYKVFCKSKDELI